MGGFGTGRKAQVVVWLRDTNLSKKLQMFQLVNVFDHGILVYVLEK